MNGLYNKKSDGFSFLFFYFEQYLFRGAEFNEAGLNGALVKRKTNTKDSNTNR